MKEKVLSMMFLILIFNMFVFALNIQPACASARSPEVAPLPAIVDFHPDILNLGSRGEWVTAYIELPEGYNVSDIDISSVFLNNTISVDTEAPITIGDYDSDIIADLMVKFNETEVVSHILNAIDIYPVEPMEGKRVNVTLTLTGEFHNETLFHGSDVIGVIGYDVWDYMKQHLIVGSPSGAQVNYQIKLTLHYGAGTDSGENVYCNNNCRGDFGDIRFLDSDDNPLDYWIEEKTDFDRAEIWVEVPYIPTHPNTTKIYVLYGNPYASTISNGNDTFLLFDNFDDESFNTTLWENISQSLGSVSETGDVLELYSPPGHETAAQIRSKVSYKGQCSIHVRWRTKTPPNLGGAAIVRVSDDVDPYLNNEGVEFWWGGISWALDNFTLLERNIQRVITNSIPEISRWYNIELKLLKYSAEVWVDDIENAFLSTKDYTDNETLEVGMRANSWVDAKNSKITQYDWIFLRKLCGPEPIHGAPGELGMVTFSASGLDSSASETVLVIDGDNYTYTDLPKEFEWEPGEIHSFKWNTPIDGGSGRRFAWASTSGLSTRRNGSLFVPFGEGSISASYETQYSLKVTSAYGDPNPTSGWFDAGTLVAASVSSPILDGTGTLHICTGWTGTGSVPYSGNETSVTFSLDAPSNLTWNWETLKLSLFCRSSTSYTGFGVEINGNLTSGGDGLSGVPIQVSYSVTGGQSWEDLTFVYTDSDGGYSAVWMPSVTGNYLIKAVWTGNATFPEMSAMVNLVVTPFKEQNVFSVTSNSTVSSLVFNSTSRELSFTVTGPLGTTGQVNVHIAKTLVGNIAEVKVYLDDEQTNYTATALDDSWLLHLTYQHSTHKIIVNLGVSPTPFTETPLGKIVIYGIPLATLAVVVIILFFKRHR